uniref:Uncharacterized protein n=1 Tax=Ascaris lumbricoides TaxID=6252 RepID=A0A0M3HRP2_ASCLU
MGNDRRRASYVPPIKYQICACSDTTKFGFIYRECFLLCDQAIPSPCVINLLSILSSPLIPVCPSAAVAHCERAFAR